MKPLFLILIFPVLLPLHAKGQIFAASDKFARVSLSVCENDSLEFVIQNLGADTLTVFTPRYFHLSLDWKDDSLGCPCKLFASLGEDGNHLGMIDKADFEAIPPNRKMVIRIGADAFCKRPFPALQPIIVQIRLRYSHKQFLSGVDSYDAFLQRSNDLMLFTQTEDLRSAIGREKSAIFLVGFFHKLGMRWEVME